MTLPPRDRLLVPADRLRWRPPRAWALPRHEPGWPDALLGQDALRDELRLLLASRGHVVVSIPETVDWAGAVGHALRSLDGDGARPIVVAAPATEAALRGVDGPGLLARAHGGVLVVDARDLIHEPAAWQALAEALRARQSTPTARDGTPQPHPARFALAMLAPEAALAKLREPPRASPTEVGHAPPSSAAP